MPHDTPTTQQNHSPDRADDQTVATAGLLTAPPSTPATVRAQAIPTGGYRVIVTEHRTRGLVDRDDSTYVSPPQSEQQARCLIMLLTGAAVAGNDPGPWRQPIAGGRRIIELERQR